MQVMKSKQIFFLSSTTWFILILATIAFILFIYDEKKWQDSTEFFLPQFQNLSQAQLKIAEAHLWFEELISGDTSIRFNEVTELLEHANRVIKNNKQQLNINSTNIDSQQINQLIQSYDNLYKKVEQFKHIATKRWKQQSLSLSGSEIDQKFDQVFDSILQQSQIINTITEHNWNEHKQDLVNSKQVTIVLWGVITLFAMFLVERYSRTSQKMKNALQQQNESLETTVQTRTLELTEKLDIIQQQNSQLETARDVAEAATKAKSQFLATMSHEIRTPMNGVIGMTELMLETPLDTAQQEYIKTIQQSGDALLVIINDILDFSKIESNMLELENIDFNLWDFVECVIELFRTMTKEKGLELSYHIDERVPHTISTDMNRLRQVLVNLINNAIKFTHQGLISLLIENDTDDRIKFTVKDTGIGISPQALVNLFQPFTQADSSTTRKYGGTGLGLTISKKIIEFMGGDIYVNSEENRGSEFIFTIKPIASVMEAECSDKYKELFKDKNILIVDDNDVNLKCLTRICGIWHMNTIGFDHPQKAFDYLTQKSPEFDLALLDYNMPEFNGIDLARKIHSLAQYQGLPMSLLSSSDVLEDPCELHKHFLHHMTKPLKKQQMATIISQLLGQNKKDDVKRKFLISDSQHTDFSHVKVLLVEDNLVNQKVASGILKKLGIGVDVAQNGLEAVKKAQENSYQLIFMDMQMPVMDGITATNEIRKLILENQPTIIAMTANTSHEDKEKCIQAGMDDFISKPFKLNKVESVLYQWFDQ